MSYGCVEGVRRGLIVGSVKVPQGRNLSVGLLDGGVLLNAVDIFSLDEDADGLCGFSIPLPSSLYDGEPHELTVFVEADGRVALSQGNFVFYGAPRMLNVPLKAVGPPEMGLHGGTLNTTIALSLLKSAQLQSAALERALARFDLAVPAQAFPAGCQDSVIEKAVSLSPVERYGREIGAALYKRGNGRDFLWFGVIDWTFRIQRPQHLAMSLADEGCRVFYISISFGPADGKGRFEFISNPYPGVFEMRMKIAGTLPDNIYGGFTGDQIDEIVSSVDELIGALNISEPTAVLQYPTWLQVAAKIPGVDLVHDCLDYVGGFSNVPEHVVTLERSLVSLADTVITTSKPLQDHLLPRASVIVRNAADVAFFGAGQRSRTDDGEVVIGYFGAIAEWFQSAWVEEAARQRPEWTFRLIGSTAGADLGELKNLPNIELLGELPYATLPDHLADFDVAIIPFKLTPLIECTNPVKLYEYAAGGKPIVASRMPELEIVGAPVFVADEASSFVQALDNALVSRGDPQAIKLKEWAGGNDWSARGREFLEALPAPRVSVIILAYNNWSFTSACINSVMRFSDYENLEIIVVDNASRDETPSMLRRMARRDERIKIIVNDSNLGFAGGNNVGLAAASGEYLILLNNDTYVTRGWIRDLIRPLRMDDSIGLAGPLTNNIGNEQKIAIAYRDMEEMAAESRSFIRRHTRERLEVNNLAFFCVALRRDIYEKLGGLDEAYGVGFFEDDDYCRRVTQAGYKIVIADDVFVHHHLSASFSALGDERRNAQLERNRAIYEEKWGPWEPHQYRSQPGFG